MRARFAKLESRRSPDGQEQWLNWVIRLPARELIGYVQATVRADGSASIAYELSSAYWGRDPAPPETRVGFEVEPDELSMRRDFRRE